MRFISFEILGFLSLSRFHSPNTLRSALCFSLSFSHGYEFILSFSAHFVGIQRSLICFSFVAVVVVVFFSAIVCIHFRSNFFLSCCQSQFSTYKSSYFFSVAVLIFSIVMLFLHSHKL